MLDDAPKREPKMRADRGDYAKPRSSLPTHPSPPAVVQHSSTKVKHPEYRPVIKPMPPILPPAAARPFLPPPPSPSLTSKLATELLGTALLAFVFASAVGPRHPLALTITLLCVTYAGGHVSGGHFNPAVTLSVLVRGQLSASVASAYWIIQLIGGVAGGAAAMLSNYHWPEHDEVRIGYPLIANGVGINAALLAECIGAFALCHTFLHVTTSQVQEGNSYYGIAIACVTFAVLVAIGDVSSGALNPAIAMLSLLRQLHSGLLSQGVAATITALINGGNAIWVHFVGPSAGGLLAGLVFRKTHPSQVGDGTGCLRSVREALAPYHIEAIGTCLLAFTFACTAGPPPRGDMAPYAVGCMLASQIYAGGATSGAHYNPAVTLTVTIRRMLACWESRLLVPPFVGIGYVLAQGGGAIGGGYLASLILPSSLPSLLVRSSSSSSIAEAFTTKAIGALILCLVVLQTATVARMANREYFGLAIGATLTITMICIPGGSVGGAAFNPAIALMGSSIDTGSSGTALSVTTAPWYFFGGPAAGALLAALAFRLVSADSFQSEPVGSMV